MIKESRFIYFRNPEHPPSAPAGQVEAVSLQELQKQAKSLSTEVEGLLDGLDKSIQSPAVQQEIDYFLVTQKAFLKGDYKDAKALQTYIDATNKFVQETLQSLKSPSDVFQNLKMDIEMLIARVKQKATPELLANPRSYPNNILRDLNRYKEELGSIGPALDPSNPRHMDILRAVKRSMDALKADKFANTYVQ